jgi:urease accessory protein
VCGARARFDGGSPAQGGRWGLGGATVLGLLAAVPAPAPEVVDELRASLAGAAPGELAAVTVLGDAEVLVCRTLGDSAAHARQLLHGAWRILRPALMGRAAVAPRIWAT